MYEVIVNINTCYIIIIIINCYIFGSQEILQNADDAQATKVKFFIDERSHGQKKLLHPSLAKFQGPSLLAYNDAVFTKQDWENIQKLKRSNKRADPFKVGKFGIGFNSVFHVTGK